MPILRVNFDHLPYLGVFAIATDRVAIVPKRFTIREKLVMEALGMQPMRASISRSPLIGLFTAGNSNGLVVSNLLEADEENFLSQFKLKVARMPGKYTAVGNMVLANDKGAVLNPDLPDGAIELISKTLGVPVKRGTIAGLKNVGAAGVATNKGALLHPDALSEEIETIERVLGVPADIGTACSGVKYVGICMIANSHGALVGETTTGPEIGRIESALGFI
ncbi:MAG: translation initiation factor IF-6 [Candidatus Hodarchaeaceae archaeon]|nr:translation initiation factor IF-6 [Candidatus Hodarchaeaceae archaeon]